MICKDVIVLGASYRLLTYLDPARAAQVSPQADETDSKRPYDGINKHNHHAHVSFTIKGDEDSSWFNIPMIGGK